MAVSDGETITVVKDMGLVTTVFDERTLSGLLRAPGHRSHPLLDPRLLGLGGGPAGVPVGRPGRLRPRPQRQPDQHRRPWPSGPGCCRGWWPPTATWWPSCWPRPTATPPTRTPRPLPDALRAVLPTVEGAFSLVCIDADRLYGVRDPHGFRPLCLGRLGPADRPRAGCWRRRRRPWTSSAPPSCGSSSRASWSSSTATGSAPSSSFGPRADRAPPVHLRVRLLRPARRQALRPRGARRPAAGWASCWPSRPRWTPTW